MITNLKSVLMVRKKCALDEEHFNQIITILHCAYTIDDIKIMFSHPPSRYQIRLSPIKKNINELWVDQRFILGFRFRKRRNEALVEIYDEISDEGIEPIPELVVQALVRTNNKTSEGRIILQATAAWFDIVNVLIKEPKMAFQISSEKWEELIAAAYKEVGFDEVTLTPRSGDFGRDVIAIKRGLGIVRVIDQVKAYRPGHLVTAKDVSALIGVLHGDGASKGFLTTTSGFAPRLLKNPLIAPFIPSRIELIDGEKLISRLAKIAEKKS